ncbi:MAG: MerR family transcriptional regulator [Caldilineales bacterium]|nr:MerR family transcriptional regulator [Caldilineales bacterium]MCW5858921.1 MerR family transcriptional regulator [Caldilineales bacterium]
MAAHLDDTPTFNLKAVVQDTGLKPDTLRAWERRYGLPSPGRTTGKHRLYSQRDIEILKWLNARQEDGLSISRAVDLWRKLESEGEDPLAVSETVDFALAPPTVAGQNLVEVREGWVRACLDYDEARAEAHLAQAFALFPPEVVVLEVLRQGMVMVGDGWHRGEITAQQEHFTSELAVRRLEALIGAIQPTRPTRIVVGCPPEETHTFSPLVINFLLRRQGHQTLFLGANIPITRFEATLAQTRPHLVILTAQLLHTAATLADMAETLRQTRIPLGFGGLVFAHTSGLAARIPGHYLGDRMEAAVSRVERLFSAPAEPPTAIPLPSGYDQAIEHYLDQRPLIGARVSEMLQGRMADLNPFYLFIANTNLAQNIHAALRLGNLDFLGPEMTWIRSLLYERQIPDEALNAYIRAYADAAKATLDARGAPIIAWLDATLAHLAQANGQARPA